MKKASIWLIVICAVLSVAVCVALFARGGQDEEPTVPTTTTAAPTTEPTTAETLPQVTEPEPVIIQAGHIEKHMKGKNGDKGIYFSMQPNEVPADTTWVTEFRPTSKSTIQLIRDGETYDIGKTAGGMVIKYSETEYYLKLEEYLIRDYYPIRDNDIIKVEGIFRNGDTLFQIDTSYMLISEGLVFYTTEYPEGLGVSVKYVGHPTSHPKGMTSDGIYFTLENNSVPYKTDWSLAYTPASESSVRLIRDGKTYNIGNKAAETIVKYSDTEYYLKLEKWMIKDFYPIRDGDIIVLSGKFVNSGVSTVFSISQTYISITEGILTFSEEYPTGNAVEPVKIPTMLKHPNGLTGTGLYFSAEKNDLPFDDWSIEYYPREASCVKLIRGGVTKDIGNVDAAAIVKFGETEYYLKLEQWIYKDNYPFVDGDILVIEGRFVNSGMGALMEIGKTYILISDGMALLSTEYPTGNTVEAVKIPTMLKHPNGLTGTGLYFTAEKNDLPFDDWSIEYYPREASCVKLIRGGVTKDIGNVDAAAIVKFNETGYYLKLEQWIYKDNYPFVDGDILVIEGKFVNSGMGALMEIGKTYILISDGMAYLSTEYPTGPVGPTKIQGGTMSSHPNGWKSEADGGLYFKLDANDAPFATDWSLRYVPTTTATIKLIRNGVTTDVANTGAEMLVKYSEDSYYLEFWPISLKPIVEGDTLVIEGSFVNAANNVVLVIDKTYVTIENGQPVFITEVPPMIEAGHMQPHANGWNTSNNEGLYFKLNANEVPYDGWNTEYEPVSAASIKLIRGEETFNIGQPGKGTIVKYGDTDYYLKLEAWTIGAYAPIVPGDVLIVEGAFKNADSGVTFEIKRSVIAVGDGYVLTFTQEENVDTTIQAGAMSSHPNGWNTQNNNGLYFTLASNDIPFRDDWTALYTPTTPKNIQLIRGGETLDIAKTDREYIVKYGDTDYYLKLEKWTIGDYFPLVPGDVVIVEGKFNNPITGVAFNISKTYITIGENYVLTFDTEGGEPENPDVPAGDPMAAHGTNGWTATGGLYFTMAKNDAPYDGWNTRYTPVAASCVKLIRGGTTYDVGHTARETIVKYSDTEYYYEFWTLDTYKPVLAGDVLVVEGDFVNTASGATLTIAKTTITFNADGTATFQSEGAEPEDPETTEPENTGLVMKAWEEKAWNTGSNGGFWFTMDSNDIPADDTWALEYTPVSEDVLKLVRNGQTVNIGIPGRGTLIKASDAEYYLKLEWNIGDYANAITVGDQIVVEGTFTNSTNGYTFTVKKTTVTIGENYELTFETEEADEPDVPDVPDVPEDDAIAVGAMTENSGGITSGIIYFTLAENSLPSSLTKSDFRPVSAGVIKLIRNGQTYDIADPNAKTFVKQTATKYRLLRSALTMELQAGDVLVVEGNFTGGNTDATDVFTMAVTKTYITIGDGTVSFSTVPPEEE